MIYQYAFSKSSQRNILLVNRKVNAGKNNGSSKVIYCAVGEGIISFAENSAAKPAIYQQMLYRLSVKAIYQFLGKVLQTLAGRSL